MSDSDPSGAVITAAETASAPNTPPLSVPTPGPFSNNRGSGLARGKRSTSPAPQAATGAPAPEYKPTAVSIVAAPTEYKNPFAPPAPVAAPAETSTVETATPAPSPVPAPAATIAPAIQATEASIVSATSATEAQPLAVKQTPATPLAVEPKPELKILPPETPRRVEQSWESQSFRNVASQPDTGPAPTERPQSTEQRPQREDRRGDRPYFRSERERRNDRPYESGAPRSDVTPSEQAPSTEQPQDKPAPVATEAKKSGGLFAWVKSLFGGSPAEEPKPETKPETSGQREGNAEGPYRRRRHRGGRNRNFQGDQRGPRDGQQGGQRGYSEGQQGGQPSGDQRGFGGDQRGYRGDNRGYRNDQRGYRGEQRGYRGGDQRGYDGQNRGQGNRRRGPEGGDAGFRGQGRPEGGPPPTGS